MCKASISCRLYMVRIFDVRAYRFMGGEKPPMKLIWLTFDARVVILCEINEASRIQHRKFGPRVVRLGAGVSQLDEARFLRFIDTVASRTKDGGILLMR